MKRLLLSLVVVGLIAIPALAQAPTPMSTQYLGPTITNHATKALDPAVYLENSYRNNAGWLSWYGGNPGLEFVDEVSTIFSQSAKAQLYGNNMLPGGLPEFKMTGFDVGWYSLDTNTTHVQVMTVNFYDNPGGADSLGYYAGTVYVTVPPTLLQSYTVTATNAPGAHFDAYELVADLGELDGVVMPSDLWMGVTWGAMPDLSATGAMLVKDWGLPQPQYPVGHPLAGTFYPQWGWIGGPVGSGHGAEYGHSDWWWAGGWSWNSYFNGPPMSLAGDTGPPYYDAYNPRGSFTYSIYGIPEPATLGLLALSGLAMIRRRR